MWDEGLLLFNLCASVLFAFLNRKCVFFKFKKLILKVSLRWALEHSIRRRSDGGGRRAVRQEDQQYDVKAGG